jgi:hypothetical protein
MELINQNKNVSLNEILNAPGLVFGGVDYSLGKMIGQDFNDPNNIVHHVIGAWNQLFYTEVKKYDVFKAFGTSNGVVNSSIVAKNNSKIDPGNLRTNLIPVINREDLDELAKTYHFDNEDGYAIVFVQEYYCKPYQNASYWVIAVRKSDNKVTFAKPIKVSCKGGFGFKNYWATTILHLLTTIEKRRKTWKKR